jgi:hypothetical protein
MRQLIAAARIHHVPAHPCLRRLRITIANGVEDNSMRRYTALVSAPSMMRLEFDFK